MEGVEVEGWLLGRKTSMHQYWHEKVFQTSPAWISSTVWLIISLWVPICYMEGTLPLLPILIHCMEKIDAQSCLVPLRYAYHLVIPVCYTAYAPLLTVASRPNLYLFTSTSNSLLSMTLSHYIIYLSSPNIYSGPSITSLTSCSSLVVLSSLSFWYLIWFHLNGLRDAWSFHLSVVVKPSIHCWW